jgi:hypothetical protein
MKDFFIRDMVTSGNLQTFIVRTGGHNVPEQGEVVRLDGKVVTVLYAMKFVDSDEYALRLMDERNNEQ